MVNFSFFKSNPSFSRDSNKVLILVLLYISLILDGSFIKNLNTILEILIKSFFFKFSNGLKIFRSSSLYFTLLLKDTNPFSPLPLTTLIKKFSTKSFE